MLRVGSPNFRVAPLQENREKSGKYFWWKKSEKSGKTEIILAIVLEIVDIVHFITIFYER